MKVTRTEDLTLRIFRRTFFQSIHLSCCHGCTGTAIVGAQEGHGKAAARRHA
jgi:hypothetical protein